MANYRNRKLLDLAHRVTECTHCGRYSSHGCEPAHENSIEAGKGFGIKSRDQRHAAMCNSCHGWYDQGKGMDPTGVFSDAEKTEVWNRAHKRTYDLYFEEGWLVVS